MPDRYASFAALAAAECKGVDYEIEIAKRNSRIAIIAPHGGHIEPMTTEIARAIAGADFSFYSFTGLRRNREHCELHITSHNFDEPQCVKLVSNNDLVLAIHGRHDKSDKRSVCIGGRYKNLKEVVARLLERAGFSTELDGHKYPAIHPMNICNRGRSGRGMQLELPRSLRDHLAENPARLKQFAGALREALGAAS